MKKTISGLLAVSLLASAPWSSALAQAPNPNYVTPIEEKDGSKFNTENYDFAKFSEIGVKLQEIAKSSKRIKVEVTGESADGFPLYVVTIADTKSQSKFGENKALREQMIKNPEKAQEWIKKNKDFKVPIMINGSIHGTEFIGSDAVLQLIERFAKDNDNETKKILDNNILIFNVVANPDGRVDATRFNGEGIDLNRDFITQSQPETRQMVDLITEWNPMVFLDTHGYVKNYAPNKQGLIEPCTPPHNPNYEYDLYNKWAYGQAEAMESSIMKNKAQFKGDLYKNMTGTYVPQRDDEAGWDDYPPIFTPMYAMYHGAYGHTLEAPTNDEDGVKWMYDAIMGALNYSTTNKQEMLNDQIEIFKRGINFDHPYHEEGFFPEAYVLPVDEKDPTVTEKAVNHLINNDIDVVLATKDFTADGVKYAKGSYIVNLNQAKAGLANTMLWDGEDITDDTPSMYDISAWSLPELWGFKANPVKTKFSVSTAKVKEVDGQGSVTGKGPFVIPNSSVQAVELVNTLIQQGVNVRRDNKGNFYVSGSAKAISSAVKASGLQIESGVTPVDAKKLTKLKVALLEDGGMNKQQTHAGMNLALERLGFEVTELTPVEVAKSGLKGYDAFIYNGTENLISTKLSAANLEFGFQNADQFTAFKKNVDSFVKDGGKFIAAGAGASRAAKTLGLTNATVQIGDPNSNGIVNVDYDGTGVTAGYGQDDIGFVYRPTWYGGVEENEILATYDESDFFLAGHWKGNEKATSQPVIIRENDADVTLIGLEPAFRDHTDYLFRLISNALYTN
ncbi:M14 family zinc carboxypeptidase [Planococcus sp. N028]|uniref:M14 family zinc carboxypeptidase n=1 Tax=Planococcus shixiaomingii TaxID=3058393 RepID=A0ABT8N518_9BACL|nr:M14 family zinc carboxypeptidase [Planococcus sp. N028]MDN7242630.1 M14 family zinc carboxypeptidase [Planococcus sp. N028]